MPNETTKPSSTQIRNGCNQDTQSGYLEQRTYFSMPFQVKAEHAPSDSSPCLREHESKSPTQRFTAKYKHCRSTIGPSVSEGWVAGYQRAWSLSAAVSSSPAFSAFFDHSLFVPELPGVYRETLVWNLRSKSEKRVPMFQR